MAARLEPTAATQPLTLVALAGRAPWSLPLDARAPTEFGRCHATLLWGSAPAGQEDRRCGSISRAHLRLEDQGDGSALLTRTIFSYF